MAEVAWELREVKESSGRLVAWTWEALASFVRVSVTVCSSNWSGAVVLGDMSPGASKWGDWDPRVGYWAD